MRIKLYKELTAAS